MYGSGKVIKFSKLSFFVGNKFHNKYINDYRICKKYFGKYIVDVKDVIDLTVAKHIEIQQFIIDGEMLAKKHTEIPYIKEQLINISQILDKMKNDRCPVIDLLGNFGMFNPRLSNIVVDMSHNLKIIDAVLMVGRSVMPFGIILEFFIPFARVRPNYLLSTFLK